MQGLIPRIVAILVVVSGLAGCMAPTPAGHGQAVAPPPGRPPAPPPPGSLRTPPPIAPNAYDPRALAFQRLVMTTRSHPQELPGGCTALAGEHVCVPKVTVDGQRLSDMAVLSGIVAAAANPTGPRLPLQSAMAKRKGVASAILQRLLRLEAARDGIKVTIAQAKALAVKELHLFQQQPVRAQKAFAAIPPGMSVRQYFLSPRTIAGYRESMIVGRERDRILRAYPTVPPAEAFRRWLRVTLPRHQVTIDGAPPTFSLANALPSP